MSPQFVDFDADGHLDIVAGIFDGSPHVAYGSAQGWKQPEQILDKQGQRIVMNAFWNFDEKKWDSTKRCNPEGTDFADSHLTSTWAADHDGDGDLDLLLGDHHSGHVLLRINEGTAQQPAFATTNQVILAGGKPLIVEGTVTTLRLVDWNGDARLDLLCGSMGDPYGTAAGGGVYLFVNQGTNAKPEYAAAEVLIEPSPKGTDQPVRPDAGLYMDVADLDQDGDLDLLVGGYSLWQPVGPQLNAEQLARVEVLKAELQKLQSKQNAFNTRLLKAVEKLDDEAAAKVSKEMRAEAQAELSDLASQRRDFQAELDKLAPPKSRVSYVWFYENLREHVGG